MSSSIEIPTPVGECAADIENDEPVHVAQFPKGFWKGLDHLLHHPEQVMESLRHDVDLWKLATIFLTISLAMSAAYGAVMGSTNLFQGSSLPLATKLMIVWITAIKVPALFLLTLAIVLPPVYVSNTFAGARLPLRQMVALLLAAMTITTTILASMASVALFFALTSRSYRFLVLLHVVFFAYAGAAGLAYLVWSLRGLQKREATVHAASIRRQTPRWLFVAWLLLYMFVGTQLAWVMRPFVGTAQGTFQVFRPRSGNFYEAVYYSIVNLSGEKRD